MSKKSKAKSKAKAKRYNNKSLWIALAVVLVIAVIAVSYFTSPAYARTKVAATIGDQKITEAEYAYFYQSALQDAYESISSTYGANMASYVLDMNKSLASQTYSEGVSWHDYLDDVSRTSIREVHTLVQAAKDAGYELSETANKNIDLAMDALDAAAKEQGYSIPMYLRSAYGHGMNKTIYKDIVRSVLLANEYAGVVSSSFTYSDEEIDEYYQSHKLDFDTVDLRMISIDYADDGRGDPDSVDSLATAEFIASNLHDEELFAEFGAQLYDDDDLEEPEDSLYLYVPASDLKIDNMAEWFFDESRQYGDMEIFSDDEYAYYVGYFIGRHDIDYNTVNMRHILIAPEDPDGDGTFTQAASQEAYERLGNVLTEWDESDQTEETFAALAEATSDDPGSNTNGGLYTDVYKGEMISGINDWLFDPERQYGDTVTVESSYGFHVVFYCGETENNYKYIAVSQGMQTSDYDSWYVDYSGKVPVEYADRLYQLMLR